jgi:23S rRNA (cytosine1962-C5)-methyltransferase
MEQRLDLVTTAWEDYELIDSGNGEKLERFGKYILVRPDPRIFWPKSLPEDQWSQADACYSRTSNKEGQWQIKNPPPGEWRVKWQDLIFTLKPTEFKHTGVFPEQAAHWSWIRETVNDHPLKILNLFAYTGGATMAGLSKGATVTHVDSVKSALDWASANLTASGLSGKPVRWIAEDAQKFVAREVRRGNRYDGVILDPPRFGRGPKGEVWKLEPDLPKLLSNLKMLLSPIPALFLVNVYTADVSPITLANAVKAILPESGQFEFGELTIRETASPRLVPHGIFARWRK